MDDYRWSNWCLWRFDFQESWSISWISPKINGVNFMRASQWWRDQDNLLKLIDNANPLQLYSTCAYVVKLFKEQLKMWDANPKYIHRFWLVGRMNNGFECLWKTYKQLAFFYACLNVNFQMMQWNFGVQLLTFGMKWNFSGHSFATSTSLWAFSSHNLFFS